MPPETTFEYSEERRLWYSRQWNRLTGQYDSNWMPPKWQPHQGVPRRGRKDSHLENGTGNTQPTAHDNSTPSRLTTSEHRQPAHASSTVDSYVRTVGPPLTHTQPQQDPTRGEGAFVEGSYNPNQDSGPNNLHYEALDPAFHVQDRRFFKEGRVFAIILSENAGSTIMSYNSSISEVGYQGHFVHTQKRRFVVVRQKREFCYACPIFTYSGRATLKRGVRAQEHGIIYSVGQRPRFLPNETGITKSPIEVDMVLGEEVLHIASRIYYGIQHPIQYNVKVKEIGSVQSEDVPKLIGNWKAENLGELRQDIDVTGHAEMPEQSQPMQQQPEQQQQHQLLSQNMDNIYLDHAPDSQYGYDASHNPYGFHPRLNPNGYHPQLNSDGHHPQLNPNGYHPHHNPYGYHPTITPTCYHEVHNKYGYHVTLNPLQYHPTNNPLVYHPMENPHVWHSEHNQYSYDAQNNPGGYYPSHPSNQYSYHPVHNPYSYHAQSNPNGYYPGGTPNGYSYHPIYDPYGYHFQINPYGYHPQGNKDGYHPNYQSWAYHPTYNPNGRRPPNGDVGQITDTMQGLGFGNQQ